MTPPPAAPLTTPTPLLGFPAAAAAPPTLDRTAGRNEEEPPNDLGAPAEEINTLPPPTELRRSGAPLLLLLAPAAPRLPAREPTPHRGVDPLDPTPRARMSPLTPLLVPLLLVEGASPATDPTSATTSAAVVTTLMPCEPSPLPFALFPFLSSPPTCDDGRATEQGVWAKPRLVTPSHPSAAKAGAPKCTD